MQLCLLNANVKHGLLGVVPFVPGSSCPGVHQSRGPCWPIGGFSPKIFVGWYQRNLNNADGIVIVAPVSGVTQH